MISTTPGVPRPAAETVLTSSRLLWFLGLSGVLSAFFIVAATVIGVWLRPGFDHVGYTISELYEVGAPNAVGLMILFTAYHALVITLALGLHLGLPHTRHGWLGPALLGAAGALGIPLGAWARCDPGCFGATTFRGQMHAFLVLLTVPLIYGAMVAIWRRLRQHPAWQGYGRYTLITALVGIAFGLGMTSLHPRSLRRPPRADLRRHHAPVVCGHGAAGDAGGRSVGVRAPGRHDSGS